MKTMFLSALFVVLATAASSATFTDRTAFKSALDTYTEVDTSTFAGKTTLDPSVSFTAGSFFGPDAFIRSALGQEGWVENGEGFHGPSNPHVGINFVGIVNAVGVEANPLDGGRIQFFSEADGSGILLDEMMFGSPSGNGPDFGGKIISGVAKSAVFTCDFNFDLKCAVFDPVFGYKRPMEVIPLPASLPLLLAGLGGLMLLRRQAS